MIRAGGGGVKDFTLTGRVVILLLAYKFVLLLHLYLNFTAQPDGTDFSLFQQKNRKEPFTNILLSLQDSPPPSSKTLSFRFPWYASCYSPFSSPSNKIVLFCRLLWACVVPFCSAVGNLGRPCWPSVSVASMATSNRFGMRQAWLVVLFAGKNAVLNIYGFLESK